MKTFCLILLIFLVMAENLGATDDIKKCVTRDDIKKYVKDRTPAWMHKGAPFSLSNGSPALEAGTFIGTITKIHTRRLDKKNFYDLEIEGIRFIKCDAIKTEQGQEAIVVDIIGNKIILDRPINKPKIGEGIHLWFEGNKPNIGASPFLPLQPFKDAEFFIEYNSTAGDTGVQVFLDDDNWSRITISDPKDKIIFKVEGSATLGRQGLTELFFESVEPELAQLPVVKFLKRFPEGDYEFEGIRNDGVELESEVEFTHIIPCAPKVLPKNGTVMRRKRRKSDAVITWKEVTEVVDPVKTDAAGETVCTEPANLGQDLEIASYQVIVENSDVSLIVDLTAEDRALTVPPELLKKNTLYIFEVLAKEESGNQTITEGFFCTGPGLSKEECANLFEAL